jgi:hypothetical protein
MIVLSGSQCDNLVARLEVHDMAYIQYNTYFTTTQDDTLTYFFGMDGVRTTQEFLIKRLSKMVELSPDIAYINDYPLYRLSLDDIFGLIQSVIAYNITKLDADIRNILKVLEGTESITLLDGTVLEFEGKYLNLTKWKQTTSCVIKDKNANTRFFTSKVLSNVLPGLGITKEEVFKLKGKAHNICKYIHYKCIPAYLEWITKKPLQGYVYVIEDETDRDFMGNKLTKEDDDETIFHNVKIGFSTQPEIRIATFNRDENINVGRTHIFKESKIHIADEQRLFYTMRLTRYKTEYSTECFRLTFDNAVDAVKQFLN